MNSEQLLNRTLNYSKQVLSFIRTQSEKDALTSQLIRSATSIGANYREALSAESKKDFIHKVGICKKEASETLYWIELIAHDRPKSAELLRPIWRETNELLMIFSKTHATAKSNFSLSLKKSIKNKK